MGAKKNQKPQRQYFPRVSDGGLALGESVARDEIPESLLNRIQSLEKNGFDVYVCGDQKRYHINYHNPRTGEHGSESRLKLI